MASPLGSFVKRAQALARPSLLGLVGALARDTKQIYEDLQTDSPPRELFNDKAIKLRHQADEVHNRIMALLTARDRHGYDPSKIRPILAELYIAWLARFLEWLEAELFDPSASNTQPELPFDKPDDA